MSTIQGLPIAEPEEVGLSSERLARIRPRMQKYIDRQEVPCVVTLVARHGKVAHFEAQGWKDVEAGEPVAKDSIFRLFSMTKPFTAVAALMLCEEGLLTLHDPISKFLPAFKNPVVVVVDQPSGEKPYFPYVHTGLLFSPGVYTEPARREITIRDCLTNTAGFATPMRTPVALLGPFMEAQRGVSTVYTARADGTKLEPSIEPLATMADRVDRLAKLPLIFHPGTAWDYGPGPTVAGVVVEVVSGQTLEEFFRKRIFEPLGMLDSAFYLPEGKIVSRMVTAYTRVPSKGLVPLERPADSEKVKGPKIVFSGGGSEGGVLSTVPDCARFAQMLLSGGVLDGVRILGRKTVELMMTNHTGNLRVYMTGEGYGWGLGGYVRTDLSGTPEVGSVGTYGWGGGFETFLFIDRKEDMFGLTFSQVHGGSPPGFLTLWKESERLAYEALA